MKYACYFMTRNFYKHIGPSLKSLLCHADVDKVFLLTEDDDIGIKLPDKVQVMNISGQKYFTKDSPNYVNLWAWIILMRVALHHVFPDIDRILTLDLDTLVVSDISELWDIPLGNNYMAGAIDVPLMGSDGTYINAGVVMWNLKQLRDGMGDRLIEELNTHYHKYPEQDAINMLCKGHIYLLNGKYNSGTHSRTNGSPKILHFAGKGMKTYLADERVKEYAEMDWEDCVYGASKPKPKGVHVKKSNQFNLCGACGTILLVKDQKYCHECGKVVQW